MKHNFIRYSVYSTIVLLIGFVALAASRANAQRDTTNEIQVLSVSWVSASRQFPRISVVNIGDEPISANIQFLDSEGKVITQSGEIEAPGGHIKVFSGVDGSLLQGPARARIFVKFVTRKPFDVKRDQAPFMATVEIVDSDTGRAALITTEWVFVAN